VHFVELAAAVVHPPERGQRALARAAVLVAEGLCELSVGAAAGAGELDEHPAGSTAGSSACQYIENIDVPLQVNFGRFLQVLDCPRVSQPEIGLEGSEVSNFGVPEHKVQRWRLAAADQVVSIEAVIDAGHVPAFRGQGSMRALERNGSGAIRLLAPVTGTAAAEQKKAPNEGCYEQSKTTQTWAERVVPESSTGGVRPNG
jgi:hypothetical protein